MLISFEVGDKVAALLQEVKEQCEFEESANKEQWIFFHGLQSMLKKMHKADGWNNETKMIGDFISRFCIIREDAYVSVNKFREALILHCGEYKSRKLIGKYMRHQGFKQQRRYIDCEQVRCHIGIELNNNILSKGRNDENLPCDQF